MRIDAMMKRMKKIAILGFGREGKSVLKFIMRAPEFRGAEIWVLDKSAGIKLPRGVRTRTGKKYLSGLDSFNVVFRSPGIPYYTPEIQKALHAGTEISSATKLFFNEIGNMQRPPLVIGVTGTKGKGTACTLLYNMLRAAHRNAVLGGNIGTSPLALLPKLGKKQMSGKARRGASGRNRGGTRPIVILELSSFQLQDLATAPDIAVVLDVFPDHQDAHKNLKEYYDAKANLARFQKPPQRVFFFGNNPMSARAAAGHGEKIAVDEKRSRFFTPEDIAMPGLHNFKNAVMAATVARSLGVSKPAILRAAERFRGNVHRLEFVKRVGNTRFYNDSASTNPHTSAAAVAAFPGGATILIAGGKDKNLDYAPLAKALKKSRTAGVVLCGENKKKIFGAIKNSGVPIALTRDLPSAVRLASRSAKALSTPARPAVVLFSPGATSFDMFTDYAARGAQFKTLVKKLK